MKLVKQSYEIIPQENFLVGMYKHIEKAGRICYKSEDKITEDSAKKFVERMIISKHTAMLEHGTVYLKKEYDSKVQFFEDSITEFYTDNPYSKCLRIRLTEDRQGKQLCCITTNYRVLIENDRLDDLKYLCEPTKYHEKRITVKFTTDQGILREFTRHRVFSFAVESTRQWRH